ncbi:MAG: recombinase family protein [Oscillospiraceae bacterium]|jgi:DNA invertase Pin-like site-specific DNA recombinase|nr:recombinase family protein [Oscillospiraceae bacterium]
MPTNLEVAVYLRKSRDEEQAGVADTLARHREVLLRLVDSMRLVLLDVYEEVVSGESLYARPEMLRLLEAVQDGRYDAVLCMDIDRLGRGGMSNQGTILDAFKFSDTKIITPDKTYDLSDDTDEQLLEFKTFMSRQEYKLIQKRLQRGLHQTIAAGGYIANAPYGYRKATVDKKPTLEICEPEARFVRMIFDLYCDGVGAHTIAQTLDAMGAVPHRSAHWGRNSVRHILKNPTYCGKIVWYKKQHIRPGKRGNAKTVTVCNPPDKWQICDGLHPSIIAGEQFEKARAIRERRYAPPKNDGSVKSPLAGLVVCAVCGHNMQRMLMHKGAPYLLCNTPACCAGAKLEYVEDAILSYMSDYLARLDAELSAANAEPERDYSVQLALIRENLTRAQSQKERLYTLLEQGAYDVQTYRERMAALTERIVRLEEQLAAALDEKTRAARSNKLMLRENIADVLAVYASSDAAGRNALLKSAVDRVIYTKPKKSKPRDFTIQIQFLSFFL